MASPGKTVRTPAYDYNKDDVASVGTARALVDNGKAKGVFVVSVSLKNLTELVKSIQRRGFAVVADELCYVVWFSPIPANTNRTTLAVKPSSSERPEVGLRIFRRRHSGFGLRTGSQLA